MKKRIVARSCVGALIFFALTFTGCTKMFNFMGQNEKMPLSVQVYYVYRAGGTGPLLPIPSGGELNSGDRYKVVFRANRDCYVYVYQTEATGQVFRLFPLEQFDGVILNHENPIKILADYVLPANDRFFYLDDTIGKEKIYVAASLQRNRDLEELENRLTNAMQTKDEKRISKASRDIYTYLDRRGNGATFKTQTQSVPWQTGETTTPITGYLFETHQKDSVHTIEFMHR